jgi:hypothetical protein
MFSIFIIDIVISYHVRWFMSLLATYKFIKGILTVSEWLNGISELVWIDLVFGKRFQIIFFCE